MSPVWPSTANVFPNAAIGAGVEVGSVVAVRLGLGVGVGGAAVGVGVGIAVAVGLGANVGRGVN